MRSTQTCPKCAGQKFAVIEELRQPVPKEPGSEPIRAIVIDGTSGWERARTGGSFETWICVSCGFAELYVCKLPRDIEEIAKKHPDRVRIVDAGPPEQGPYR